MPRLRPAPIQLPPTDYDESDPDMPRGGSKKGEHRGAARREAKRQRSIANLQRGGAPGKGKQHKKTRERLAIIGAEIGVAQLDGFMPKDMMLRIARTFMQMALNEQAKIAELQTLEDVDALTGSYERHLVLAGDMAYKAGAYYHPRLQALMVGGASDKSPGDILRSMLEEIDGESRLERQQVRQIEQKTETAIVPLKQASGD